MLKILKIFSPEKIQFRVSSAQSRAQELFGSSGHKTKMAVWMPYSSFNRTLL